MSETHEAGIYSTLTKHEAELASRLHKHTLVNGIRCREASRGSENWLTSVRQKHPHYCRTTQLPPRQRAIDPTPNLNTRAFLTPDEILNVSHVSRDEMADMQKVPIYIKDGTLHNVSIVRWNEPLILYR